MSSIKVKQSTGGGRAKISGSIKTLNDDVPEFKTFPSKPKDKVTVPTNNRPDPKVFAHFSGLRTNAQFNYLAKIAEFFEAIGASIPNEMDYSLPISDVTYSKEFFKLPPHLQARIVEVSEARKVHAQVRNYGALMYDAYHQSFIDPMDYQQLLLERGKYLEPDDRAVIWSQLPKRPPKPRN